MGKASWGLWIKIHERLVGREHRIIEVPAHVEKINLNKLDHSFRREAYIGNIVADRLAGEVAGGSQVSSHVVDILDGQLAQWKLNLRRLICVYKEWVINKDTHIYDHRAGKPRVAPRNKLITNIQASQHVVSVSAACLICTACHSFSRRSATIKMLWLATPCWKTLAENPQIHHSHSLTFRIMEGLACRKCWKNGGSRFAKRNSFSKPCVKPRRQGHSLGVTKNDRWMLWKWGK